MALVQDSGHSLRPRAATLQRLYDLTPAQAELAARIADGATPQKIAEELQLSIITVRDRLKQVFARTGTARQAEVVRLVLSGPAMLDSH